MGRATRQLLTIAHQTLLELLRAPIFLLVLLASLVLAGIVPALDYLSFLEKRRLVADSLLALTQCAGLFAAAVGATLTAGADLRRRSALLVLSKPLPRGRLLAGRLVGLCIALGLLWLCLGVAVLWGSRVAYDDYWPERRATVLYFGVLAVSLVVATLSAYRGRRSFAATASLTLAGLLTLSFVALLFVGAGRLPGVALVDWRLLPAVVLAFPALVLTAAVAVAASCWLEATPTLLVTFALFSFGLVAADLWGGLRVGSAVASLLPVYAPFWVSDAVSGRGVGWGYMLRAGASGLLQAWGVLLLATAAFERRELS